MIERLGGKEATFIEGDIRNEALMTAILHDHAIEAVIHFAGLKAVGESVAKPLEYYDNNVNKHTEISLCHARRWREELYL